MYKRITLLTLQTFGDTGGIQKMTRTLAHSLNSICCKEGWDFKLVSLYDNNTDLMPQYIPEANFKGYSKKKISFLLHNVFTTQKPDVVILSHINLAVVGLLIKQIRPRTKIWLVAHGIEVWRPLSFNMRQLLARCDKILCVSTFTLKQMEILHRVPKGKGMVLNNVLDPFMHLPTDLSKPVSMQKRYGLNPSDKVILSLTRLASAEQYKGHDSVLKAIAVLKHKYSNLRYLLAGKYDNIEGESIGS
ncbi:MAG: hypothetical protein EOP54_22760 [Sphingobacteriales bacterium]|nr:MAG: hypothetical protein EOP54_22760 [Sphingobacteriales bacterium]